VTPSKKQERRKVQINYTGLKFSDFDRNGIWQKVHDFYSRKEHQTVMLILPTVKQ
jgi:hypothetical protein